MVDFHTGPDAQSGNWPFCARIGIAKAASTANVDLKVMMAVGSIVTLLGLEWHWRLPLTQLERE